MSKGFKEHGKFLLYLRSPPFSTVRAVCPSSVPLETGENPWTRFRPFLPGVQPHDTQTEQEIGIGSVSSWDFEIVIQHYHIKKWLTQRKDGIKFYRIGRPSDQHETHWEHGSMCNSLSEWSTRSLQPLEGCTEALSEADVCTDIKYSTLGSGDPVPLLRCRSRLCFKAG